ncbi:MAG: tRNA uridine-5-carboxymethylaminomethyl(34) synthesis GTPase MnmE [Deltaproteobacteria bacterium]|nr:tRNA uridine-5-carboxymethylaminomethyl(34) synthesis GTPase MnmE [Deltaproteobacteria bacterium]
MEDTIAAVATPIGRGGIGIVRLSGDQARAIAGRVFRPRNPVKAWQSHHLYLGHLVDPSTGSIVDEVLLSFMKAPHSYTREDVVEINIHSGYLLLTKVLQIVLEAGARPAKPGEFTFRAFLNGRIDLTQAEAVVDLIQARSERGLILSSGQIKGDFRKSIETLRQATLGMLARIEVLIDFPEEASGFLPEGDAARSIEQDLLEPIEQLIAAHGQRRIWVEGVNTVIVGRVNAGKSSLLNRLLNEERALVTPIPGTTRDALESTLHIRGIPLRLMDTAGFRKVKGRIERLGIQVTRQKLSAADLVLLVVDQSRPLTRDDLEILACAGEQKTLIVLNKIDLRPRLSREAAMKAFDGYEIIELSALTGQGIEDLHDAIVGRVISSDSDLTAAEVAPNLRHKIALEEALQAFRAGSANARQGMPWEIIAADLQAGLTALGEIIGEKTPEDVLDRIFSEFCIGK